MYYSKMIQGRISKGERGTEQSPQKPSASFQEFFLSGVIQNTISPTSNCDNTCVYQGNSLEMQYLRVPSPHIGTSGLVTQAPSAQNRPKFQTPRKYSAQITLQSRHNEPLQSLIHCRQLLNIQVPRCQQKHCKQAFLRKAVLGLLS